MRLIDADNYCKNLCKCNSTECDKAKCPILNAPVAYDPDKVVEQLENDEKHTFDGCINKMYAIEIVKGGGVDE